MHKIEVSFDGEIILHGNDDYPYQPQERSEEEQRIMTQVEARARFAAQQEFPDADILSPMWRPEHIKAGIEAFSNYPMEEFLDDFREYYDALRNPMQYIDDSPVDKESIIVNVIVHFNDGEVLDVSDVGIHYKLTDGSEHRTGPLPSYPNKELIFAMPELEFADGFEYEEEFADVIMSHLMAQIRDIYLNMGEDPPAEYRVEGIGKLNIVGDGIGAT
ncbi:hypothetical protein C442_20216 [Haloarcula amylolytica JCM 13557]|uniref:Uncharacterized protein n=2 Tax=Haloarcula amylolytica TaxID=396317 RepID=M0K084_9EURY|nr:hypothetical protein C442_20216 [Haloarcula amylolytica JCM 13557]